MITFRNMFIHSSAQRSVQIHLRVLGVTLMILSGLVPDRLDAQLTLTHTEDAAPIPAGTLRFRVTSSWTRWDSRFISGGTQSLDNEISSDSLGPRQLPFLLSAENGLKTLTNNPATRLT